MKKWKEKVQTELERARSARDRGNEGQARVCARRAAGIVVREYYARQSNPIRTPSAYDLLHFIQGETHLAPDLVQAAVYLTLRVNEEFKLPDNVDLLEEARKLYKGLLPD